ncbi:type II secretion system protein GspG [Pyxidicoccus caerfyrddinensis]|uniref:type II secretion system protein GspG n=1 Tax=Pyxidicoccus caerfyrddinensis TaxID=2709663 RepID=UPI0019680A62|nr:type II secretion system protein GspG [Pyxidicoccus caerfyrddinensis]
MSRSFREAAKAILVIAVGLLGLALLSPLFISVTPAHGKLDRALLDLRSIESAFRLYVHRTGQLPSKEAGLRVLVEAGILEVMPMDPWGNPYAFSVTEDGQAEVSTLGADGEPGGDESDEDLVRRFRLSVPSR